MAILKRAAAIAIVLIAIYLLVWPVPVDPVSWDAPRGPGFTGAFAPNTRLANLETLPIGDHHGPETIAVDANGRVHAAVADGGIVRLGEREPWVDTGGRPLGIKFDHYGNLIVADAHRGLLRIAPDKTITVLATFQYANSVDIAADGKIWFTESSTKFAAREWGGTYAASLLDILEHGGHGRLLVHDPITKQTAVAIAGLNFANGVAVAHDSSYVLVAETGSYRVLRHWLAGPKRGRTETLLENLPGFPDNLSTGLHGRYWLGFASPRNKLLDALSDAPFARKMVQRLPAVIRPKAVAYGHIAAFDGDGRIIASLQDPRGAYRLTTGATETDEFVYVSSLEMPSVGRISKRNAGLTR